MDRLHPSGAESAVLGGIILNNALLDKVNLTEEDFFLAPHQWVFRAMLALAESNRPIDELTIEHELSKRPSWNLDSSLLEKSGGTAFIAQLGLRCPTESNTLAYADIVREGSRLRRMQRLAGDLSNRVERGDSSESVRGLLSSFLEESPSASPGLPSLAVADHVASPGLPTGLGIEKYVPGGLPCDKVTTLIAESGHGKSTVKNAIMFNLARAGHKVLDVSLEDSAGLTVARYLAQKHNVPYGQLAAGLIKTPPLDDEHNEILGRIVDGSRLAPQITKLIKAAKTECVKAVFVDYIQLLEGCSGDHTQLAEAMRLIQLASKDEGIAWVVVSQPKQELSYRAQQRDAQGRKVGDPRPTMADCLGSTTIKTHTKLGIGIFHPWKYTPAPTSEVGPYGLYCRFLNNYPGGIDAALKLYESLIEIIIDKNVLGPCKVTVNALVDWPTGKITPFEM